jgi:non-specific serine/threonine protein kinase
MEESGLMVSVPIWWRKRPKAAVTVRVGAGAREALFGAGALLSFDVSAAVGGQELTKVELESLLRLPGEESLVWFKDQWVEVDREKLKECLGQWERAKRDFPEGLSFFDAMRLLSGLPAERERGRAEALPEPGPWMTAEAGGELKRVLAELRALPPARAPESLSAVLRPYQERGYGWLRLMTGLGLGACLADDMGLGKTIQVLALLLHEREARLGAPEGAVPPSLLVAPASLLANWRREAARFAPTLRLKTFHPSETPKERLAEWEADPGLLAGGCDLVVTSYSMAARRQALFSKIPFSLAILDEAQAVKNPGAAKSRAVKSVGARARLALTGTPVENSLTDLWSLFDFICPGLLGSLTRFQSLASRMEEGNAADRYAPLRRLTSHYILRRLKTDKSIIADLPEKTETMLCCGLTAEQARLYQKALEELKKKLAEQRRRRAAGLSAASERRGVVLKYLNGLKQLINHPAQYTGDGDWRDKRSGKFARLAEVASELAARQEKVLVFSQYREVMPALLDLLGRDQDHRRHAGDHRLAGQRCRRGFQIHGRH